MSDETGAKTHYLCQTYTGSGGALKVDKQFTYTTAEDAQGRAEREFAAGHCVGADAYEVVEDTASGEVGMPVFFVRLGDVPEFEEG